MPKDINDIQFSDNEWSILRYLYHRDFGVCSQDDIEIIAMGLKIDKPLALLTVAKLINEGYVSRFVDVVNQERYVLSLEGYQLMRSRNM